MERVARYVKFIAEPGHGKDLAGLLLRAGDDLGDDPGCLLYLVNREKTDPDAVWVTELWRSQADLDAAMEKIRGSDETAAALRIIASAERYELDLLGGKGPASS